MLNVGAVPALNVEACSLGRECAGSDDNAGNADEMRHIRCGQATDGCLRDGGVE